MLGGRFKFTVNLSLSVHVRRWLKRKLSMYFFKWFPSAHLFQSIFRIICEYRNSCCQPCFEISLSVVSLAIIEHPVSAPTPAAGIGQNHASGTRRIRYWSKLECYRLFIRRRWCSVQRVLPPSASGGSVIAAFLWSLILFVSWLTQVTRNDAIINRMLIE